MTAEKIYDEEKETHYNSKSIMFVLLLGGFISLFNETILNVAFPTLMAEMHITATAAQWLTTGYVLVVGILLPVTAFLIHTFTTKQLYVSAMLIFLVGTVLAAFSTSFPTLLIARVIQGCGTGMLIPIMMNSALAITPREKHGSVMGLCICIITLGPALGPVVSGLLLQYFNWHSLFILIIPFLIFCIVLGYVFLTNTAEITKPKIDYLSILLSTIGFAGIIFAVSVASTSSVLTTAAIFGIGLIALILFSKRQLSLEQPILDIRAFKHPVFSICVILVVLIQMFQFSINMMLPLLLQNGLKTSSLVSALVLFPAILVAAILTPFVGKIYDKIGGKTLIPAGLFIMCIFTFILSRVTPSTSVLVITLIYCFIMIGMSMCMSTSQTAGISQLPTKGQSDGVAIISTSMQIAGALGSALFVGIMTAYQSNYLRNRITPSNSQNQIKAIYSGFGHSVTVAAILIGFGFVISLFIRKSSKKINA
ncbi:MDR family MFS transporter [Clostridium akagii]|uniref:MDR family MFS transporter n=1 Tax=Clostridium akagii TaxID=91623 RepID=UPI000479AC4A|nr:MDR family MFS transporter [Clostridium akagii]